MERTKILAFTAAILLVLSIAMPAGAKFIGTSVGINKQFGNSINIDVGKNLALADGSAFGIGDMSVGVNWGVGVDLDTAAGYPYGYGGIGAVTQGGIGYGLGLTLDSTSGGGFDGSGYGIPLAEQGVTTTHFGQQWTNVASLNNANAILPFSGFPTL